jgi:hypothetical protein
MVWNLRKQKIMTQPLFHKRTVHIYTNALHKLLTMNEEFRTYNF